MIYYPVLFIQFQNVDLQFATTPVSKVFLEILASRPFSLFFTPLFKPLLLLDVQRRRSAFPGI
jgi:hypothetical protein